MWNKAIGVIVCVMLSLQMLAQTKESYIEGRIVNEANKPISDVNVFVSKLGHKQEIFTACLSDTDGSFSLFVKTSEDSLCIHVSGFDIAHKEVVCSNKSQKLDITVEEKAQEIKEINVRAPKVYSVGDTINYNVVQFQNKNDISIGQVLERLPGITVTESGKIQYKGLDIKNFYIEGLDLLKGRYGLATKNIDPNAIGTIQILENHQDVKALKDLRPEERASINLKLKSGVKGVFNLFGTFGAGTYESHFMNSKEFISTYFRKNSQLFVTYKDNNTGTDIASELTSFDENDNSRTPTVTDIAMPSAPGIGKQYYYFNKTYAATLNQVFRVGQNGELGANAVYLSDRDRRLSQSTSNTLLPDATRNIVDETFSGTKWTDVISGDLTYLLNNDSTYIKEQVKYDWSSSKASSSLYTIQEVNQNSKVNNYRLYNSFHITKRSNLDGGFEFISKFFAEKKPHSLVVTPCLFPNILDSDEMSQEAETRNISSSNSLQLLSALVLGKARINPSAILNVAKNELNSSLQKYKNDISLNSLDAGLGVNASINLTKLYFSIYVTGKYKLNKLSDRNTNATEDKQRFVVEPIVSLLYKIKPTDEIRLSGSINYTEPTIENLYGEYILTSYKQISYFDDRQLAQTQYQNYLLSYNHRNVLLMLFWGIDVNYVHNNIDILYGSFYDGQVERITSCRTDEVSNSYSTTMRFSKGFDWRRLKIGVLTTYNHSESPLLIQDEVIRYDDNSLKVKMDISCTPFNFVSIGYNGALNLSRSQIHRGASNPTLSTINNVLAVEFNLPYNISVGATATHYYNDRNENNKSFLLGEANAQYSHNRWLFTLTCDNIFDKKDYVFSYSNDLTNNTSAYTLRPRSVMLKVRCRIL
ncbi:MAG: TonB-dependent receptor [Bacteroidales bacterium]|nr:TonB-dependent receptor [Bacteroidales bacterium]